MLLVGGPRDGWCYYEEDIEQRTRADVAMGRPVEYEQTGEYLPHPSMDVACRVWQWIPPRRLT